jgi:hypothetical protein
MRGLFVPFLWVMGLTSLANGAWMLAHAWSWFTFLPGVIDTGAVNAHFIHDVGIAYALCGAGFIWCARNLGAARPLFVGITLFFVGHALGHVVEILAGLLPARHWWVDLPLVFAPALILAYLALPGTWRRVASAA